MPASIQGTRYGLVVAALGIAFIVAMTVITFTGRQHSATGLAKGTQAPPFAVPLALARLQGSADVAPRGHAGSFGEVPACRERGSGILNMCELYEEGPVVLALVVNAGSCPSVLGEMQRLQGDFPGVRFAAVSMRGSRASLRAMLRKRDLSFPVGYDEGGALASLYGVVSCPQVDFVYPGGRIESAALLGERPQSTLRSRVASLLAASQRRGWRPGR